MRKAKDSAACMRMLIVHKMPAYDNAAGMREWRGIKAEGKPFQQLPLRFYSSSAFCTTAYLMVRSS